MDKKEAYIPKGMVITGNVSSVTDVKIAGKVMGDVSCEGNIELSGIVHGNMNVKNIKIGQGLLEGDVTAGENVTIEDFSVVKGNVVSKNLCSNGRIEGHIRTSEAVELKSSAHVRGNIEAKSFSVASGASINGKVSVNG